MCGAAAAGPLLAEQPKGQPSKRHLGDGLPMAGGGCSTDLIISIAAAAHDGQAWSLPARSLDQWLDML